MHQPSSIRRSCSLVQTTIFTQRVPADADSRDVIKNVKDWNPPSNRTWMENSRPSGGFPGSCCPLPAPFFLALGLQHHLRLLNSPSWLSCCSAAVAHIVFNYCCSQPAQLQKSRPGAYSVNRRKQPTQAVARWKTENVCNADLQTECFPLEGESK